MTLAIGLLFVLIATGAAGCATWSAQRKSPPVGQFVEVDGLRLHVLDEGNKDSALPPVILIHGASVNMRDMKLALGDALAAERRVIMVDRPGRGYSSRGADSYKLAVQARAIRDAAASLGVERPVVVGQSFGGAVALAYALQFQDEMSGLVLLAPVSHEWPGDVAWYNKASGWPVAGFLLRRIFVPAYGQLTAEASVANSFAPDAPPEDYYRRSGLALLFRAGDFRSNAEDLRHLKAEVMAQQPGYATLALPVAIVTGERDPTVSPERHSKALAKEISGASLTLLPDTGHALHHARTDEILAVINAIPAR